MGQRAEGEDERGGWQTKSMRKKPGSASLAVPGNCSKLTSGKNRNFHKWREINLTADHVPRWLATQAIGWSMVHPHLQA